MNQWEVQWGEGEAGGGPGLWMRRVCEGRLSIGWWWGREVVLGDGGTLGCVGGF
jgi:hypothetical protein